MTTVPPRAPGKYVISFVVRSALRSRGPAWSLALLMLALAVGATLVRASENDPVLARVNGHEIRQSEVLRSIESLPLGDQIEPRERLDAYTRAIVQEETIFQSLLARDLSDEPELREQVRDLVFRYMQKKYVSGRIHVTLDEAREYFKSNPDLVRGEHLRVRMIVRKGRSECETLQRQIHSEADFIEKAKQVSLDARTAAHGGDFGYLMRIKGDLGFEPDLFRLQPGKMGVFESGQSCFLAWVVEHIDPPLPPFILMRDDILAFLANREEQRLLNELVEKASRNVTVEYMPAAAR